MNFERSDVMYSYMTDPEGHAYICSTYSWFIVNTLMKVVSPVQEFGYI